MTPDDVRSCVVVMTVWVESTDPGELRARVAAASSHPGENRRESFAIYGIDNLCAHLRMWLEGLVRGDATPTEPGKDASAIT